MNRIQKDKLRIDGREIHYEQTGCGAALVLTHAGFVDSRMWDVPFAALAERGYRVVRWDMSGFGRSVPAGGRVCRREDLSRLLDHLEIERAVFVGCSMGGEISLDFTLENPSRVSGLALVSTAPGGFPMQGEPPPDLLRMLEAMQAKDDQAAAEYQLRLWIDGLRRRPQDVDAEVRARAALMNRIPVENGTWLSMDSAPLNPLHPAAYERLEEVNVPTLVLAGELDHPEVLRAAQQMAMRIPQARLHTMPGCAHVPPLEDGAGFTGALVAFLEGALLFPGV